MILERKDIEVEPPELCVRVATQNDIPAFIRERGIAVLNDDTVWVCGEYAGRLVRIEHEADVITLPTRQRITEPHTTIVSVGRTR